MFFGSIMLRKDLHRKDVQALGKCKSWGFAELMDPLYQRYRWMVNNTFLMENPDRTWMMTRGTLQ